MVQKLMVGPLAIYVQTEEKMKQLKSLSMYVNHLNSCSQHWDKMTLTVNLEAFRGDSPR